MTDKEPEVYDQVLINMMFKGLNQMAAHRCREVGNIKLAEEIDAADPLKSQYHMAVDMLYGMSPALNPAGILEESRDTQPPPECPDGLKSLLHSRYGNNTEK